ncbi:MAG TPA: acyl-CoA-binding protein [Casimicrobiaceae bacterium]|jgi:carboxylesterase
MTEEDKPDDAEQAVFLIHGLGGTQYDMGSMHKRLKLAGFDTHSLTLPGHGTTPEDLVDVKAEDWLTACRRMYADLAGRYQTLHLMGMCMGALLATEVAKQERHDKGRLIALAPPVFIDGWATPWYRVLRGLLYRIPWLRMMRVEEEEPFGIKNEQLRAIVKGKFERGENFHYGWVPLACLRQVDRLRAFVMSGLKRIRCQTLVVHARQDELTSLRSADFLVSGIGGDRARMIVLENSYHMVCVDNDRELVARNVLEFLGVPWVEAGQLSDDPRMSAAALAALAGNARALLEGGLLRDLPTIGIPEIAWYQPGSNRISGIHRGAKAVRAFANEAGSRSDETRFTAFGTPVFNRGTALVPATWVARRGDEVLQSQGALLVAMRAGKVHEVRWFADDVSLEDAFWGAPGEASSAAPTLDSQFEDAVTRSRLLAVTPPESTLLDLYALYKQSSEGDAHSKRPGPLDVVGRAKYDAWSRVKGLNRDDAMRRYIALVASLESPKVPA